MATCKVTRLFCKNRGILKSIWNKIDRRNFLSKAYSCDVMWQNRLSSPILQQVDVTDFAMKLYDQLEKKGQVSAIDMDILANKLEEIDPSHLEFTEDIFYRFRHTNEALKTSFSTHYSFIRAYLELGESKRLFDVLKDKINYGIFMDNYSANMLMQHFLDKQDYRSAAKIAYEIMLQEDFGHPTTTLLAWYSCDMHWRKPSLPEEPPAAEVEEDEEQEDEDEELWQRVDWIQNPYWDDHFDIEKDQHLLGKTFVQIGSLHDDVIGRSYVFLGYALWEKFEQGFTLLEQWLGDSNTTEAVAQEAVDGFKQVLDDTITEELPDLSEKVKGQIHLDDVRPRVTEAMKSECLERFQSLQAVMKKNAEKILNINLNERIECLLKAVVKNYEGDDIAHHQQLFEEWRSERQRLVDEQIKYYADLQKVEEIKAKLNALQEKEETLRYFENLDELSLKLEKAAAIEYWEARRKMFDDLKAAVLERRKKA